MTGVFFRAFIREMAIELGLNGWVKNLDANIVEAVFEGEKEKVDKIAKSKNEMLQYNLYGTTLRLCRNW